MRVVQILVPCSDDFIGPLPWNGDIEEWAEKNGLKRDEYLAHSLTDPNSEDGQNWYRNS